MASAEEQHFPTPPMTLGQVTQSAKLSARNPAFQQPVEGRATEVLCLYIETADLHLYIETADLQEECSKRKAKVGGQ